MSELGDLLELLHGARQRSRTVRATIREWQHVARSLRAFTSDEQQRTNVGFYGRSDEPELEEIEALVRIWFEQPARVREERHWPGAEGPSVSVRDGEQWTTFAPSSGALRQDDTDQPLDIVLDPSGLIPALDFEPGPPTSLVGRNAFSAVAVPRQVGSWSWPNLPHGADSYELTVDADTGVLLRVASVYEGEAFAVREVVEIAFDEELPAETFIVVPPPGEAIRTPEDLYAVEYVSIEEAARRAPFTVLVLARKPEGFGLSVRYLAARERPREPETVILQYVPNDGTHHLTVRETAEGELEPLVPSDPAPIDRDGVVYRVVEPDESRPWLHTQVFLERDGTSLEISSDLEVETLLALAASLVPASTEPPALI